MQTPRTNAARVRANRAVLIPLLRLLGTTEAETEERRNVLATLAASAWAGTPEHIRPRSMREAYAQLPRKARALMARRAA